MENKLRAAIEAYYANPSYNGSVLVNDILSRMGLQFIPAGYPTGPVR